MVERNRDSSPDEDPVEVVRSTSEYDDLEERGDESAYLGDEAQPYEENEGSSKAVLWAVIALALLVAAGIITAWVHPWTNDDSTSSGTTATTEASTQSAAPATETQQAVVNADGSLSTLPAVIGGAPEVYDSTRNSLTPPVSTDNCGIWKYWSDVFECKKNDRDYVNGINRNAREAGFNWNDVEVWSKYDVDVRYILVFGYAENQHPDVDTARNKIRPLIPDMDPNIPVIYRDCITNTRYKTLDPFVHCQPSVRVNLAPLVLATDAVTKVTKVVDWRRDAGVFVDCRNENWLAKLVGPPPITTTPNTGTGTPPPSTPTTTRTTSCCATTTTTTTPTTTTTSTTTTTTSTTTTTTSTSPSKTNTPNPSQPPGIDPLPTYGPTETVPPPPPSSPALPPAQQPTDATVAPTIVAPDATPIPTRETPTVAPELPSPTVTDTTSISDPDAA